MSIFTCPLSRLAFKKTIALCACSDFGFLRFDVSWDSLQAQFIRTVDGRAVDEVTLRTKKGICNEWA
eukprot:1161215-Pelagomonas_calceolata.AAC.3